MFLIYKDVKVNPMWLLYVDIQLVAYSLVVYK